MTLLLNLMPTGKKEEKMEEESKGETRKEAVIQCDEERGGRSSLLPR